MPCFKQKVNLHKQDQLIFNTHFCLPSKYTVHNLMKHYYNSSAMFTRTATQRRQGGAKIVTQLNSDVFKKSVVVCVT